jgi:hypothetical protein
MHRPVSAQLMCDVKEWAEGHMDEVLANRECYDARTG